MSKRILVKMEKNNKVYQGILKANELDKVSKKEAKGYRVISYTVLKD